MKAPAILVCAAVLCAACAGVPSLRYKKAVNQTQAAGQFAQAAEKLDSDKKKFYRAKDAALFYLDKAALLQYAGQYAASDRQFALAQDEINRLYAKSISGAAGTLLINDLTAPYYVPPYEQALTFFFRGMNFLQQNDLQGALVEARKAVFYLDYLRGSKNKGYTDDAFVQYFASLVFESGGRLSDARIARTNALAAYQKNGWNKPSFPVPARAGQMGEVLIFHYNGLVPLRKSQTFQVGWDWLLAWSAAPTEGESISPEVENALRAGLSGRSVTVAYPVLEEQPYRVAGSLVAVDGMAAGKTQLVQDTSDIIKKWLQEQLPGIWFRLATRAVVKQVLATQARHAAAQAADDETMGELAGMVVDIFGALTEKADTRQWFTLPAQVRLSRLFLPAGTHQIRLLLQDGNGNIIGEHDFGTVRVKAGQRLFLQHRTAQ